MTFDMVVSISVGIGAVIGAGVAVTALFRPVIRTIKSIMARLDKFFHDWEGTPAEPGRDAVPGVMERLNRLDGELSRNGGKSVKDTVNRIEKRLEEGNETFKSLDRRIANLEGKIDS
jgi:hypothetical protein